MICENCDQLPCICKAEFLEGPLKKPEEKPEEIWHLTFFNGFGVPETALCMTEKIGYSHSAGIINDIHYEEYKKDYNCCPECIEFAETNKESLVEFINQRTIKAAKKYLEQTNRGSQN